MAEPIIIEVCERTHDRQFVEYTEAGQVKRGYVPVYHAQVKDKPSCWGRGLHPADAIGTLVHNHPELFGIEIVDLGKQAR